MKVYKVTARDWDDVESFGTYSTFTVANGVKKQLLEDDQRDEDNTHVVTIDVLTDPIELQKTYSYYFCSLFGDRFHYEVETTMDVPRAHITEADVYHHESKGGRFTVSAYGTDRMKVKELFEKTMKEL